MPTPRIAFPESLAAIEALPWVKDGLTEYEEYIVRRLRLLAGVSEQAFRDLLRKRWAVETEGDPHGTEALKRDGGLAILYVTQIAEVDVASTLKLLELPFLESIEAVDNRALETLLDAFRKKPRLARAFLSGPALLDGMRSSSATAVALLFLTAQGPEVSAAVEALPWIQDGIEPYRVVGSIYPSKDSLENRAVLELMQLGLFSPEAVVSLLGRPWVHDGFDIMEFTALRRFRDIARTGQDAVLRIVEMPFLESFERADLRALQTLETLATYFSSSSLNDLLSDPALHGGITDDHVVTVAILYLKQLDPNAAEAIGSLPWVQDGIAANEERALRTLQALAVESRKVFRALAQRSWAQDGLSPDEVTVVRWLTAISSTYQTRSDESAALRILDMPFLKAIDGVDAAAMHSLSQLFLEWEPNYLQQVLSHPTLRDGITDDQTVVVAAMQIVEMDRPGLLDTLLDTEQVTVEKRVVQLHHSGEVTLWVVSVGPGTYRTMDIFEQLVRAQEGFMANPFRTSYLVLLVADATRHRGGGGPGGVLTVDPGYEENRYLIAHELAHSYWNFAPFWLREGAAEFMTTVSAGEEFSSNECSRANSLSDLERLTLERLEQYLPEDVVLIRCHYDLGRGLFLDLYETLGDEAFRQAFGRLYLTMRDGELDGECAGLERGVCYVRAAFVTDAPSDSAALAGPVIARWYYGPR